MIRCKKFIFSNKYKKIEKNNSKAKINKCKNENEITSKDLMLLNSKKREANKYIRK
tara:strand:+ start:276 stop:443 length:168 start_codon:yes stop_codon:yes gene_type:complete